MINKYELIELLLFDIHTDDKESLKSFYTSIDKNEFDKEIQATFKHIKVMGNGFYCFI